MTKMWFSLLIHLPKWPLIPKKKHYNAKYWWVGDQLWALMPHPFFLFLFCVLLQNEVGEVFFHHHRWCLSEITRVVGHEITRVTYMAFYQIGGSCDFGGKKKRREEKRREKKKGETSQSKVTTYANVTWFQSNWTRRGQQQDTQSTFGSFNTFVLNN